MKTRFKMSANSSGTSQHIKLIRSSGFMALFISETVLESKKAISWESTCWKRNFFILVFFRSKRIDRKKRFPDEKREAVSLVRSRARTRAIFPPCSCWQS